MQNPPSAPSPTAGWHLEADALWKAGQQAKALGLLLEDLNRHGRHKPTRRVMQLVYYMFQRNDWRSAATCLALQHSVEPENSEVLLNLAVCESRSGQLEEGVRHARLYLQRHPDESMAWDVLSSNLSRLEDWSGAAEAGTRSLMLKDQLALRTDVAGAAEPAGWSAPSTDEFLPGRRNVIAFSLWGMHARYLWGALDNLLAARTLYPGWQPRIYVDATTVAPAWLQAFRELGAEVLPQPPEHRLRQRLCWRFQVANDPTVGRFLVRDIDSVVQERERRAVQAWIASGRPFHAMRDWWTHSDLMLAGMWGGIAGLLPDLQALLGQYTPPALETPNIDQWFLRDRVWTRVRSSCLVHDRCFQPPGVLPWPDPTPPGREHVGLNVHGLDREAQRQRLGDWLARLPPASGS